MDFSDNAERKNILSELDIKGDFKNIIHKHYPGWLKTCSSNYSSDYPTFITNWETICGKLNKPRQELLLVSDIRVDDNHRIIYSIVEHLTQNGYCIRLEKDFVVCPLCSKAIPCKKIWEKLKQAGQVCPLIWMDKCRLCK
jgi:hypothetical protein